SATSADTATNATQLGGVAANQFVQTNDARLSDTRAPTAGSANYIQNTTSVQVSSNFNIIGNGTAGGTLSGNIVNAITQYNIGGVKVLSAPGTGNIFAGFGPAATSGNFNSFFGNAAGFQTTTGQENTFVGDHTAFSNTGGSYNTAIGAEVRMGQNSLS